MATSARPYSLRRRLLFLLVVPLVVVGGIASFDTNRHARDIADTVSDRVLAGSALAIGERVVVGEDGKLEVDVPYVALDMLTSAAQDRVFYRVEGPSGAFITGYRDLPEPEGSADQPGNITFFNAAYRGDAIRVGVLSGAASSGISSLHYRVTVAETTNARANLARDILLRSALRQALLIASAALAVWLAVTQGLKPLYRLSEAIARRTPGDLLPIQHRVPTEVSGLVTTVNGFMERLNVALAALRHFTGNAAHQLRTPLAIVRTQLALANRAQTIEEARAAVAVGDEALVHADRVLSQLMLLARVDEAASNRLTEKTVDLAKLAETVTAGHVREAAEAGIDLGFESRGEATVKGDAMLLGELLRNLVENAIRYAGRGSAATVRVNRCDERVVLEVEDNGAGIPLEARGLARERFGRVRQRDDGGAGLGLSIIEEIATLHGGTLELGDGPGGKGVTARVSMAAEGPDGAIVPPEPSRD